MVRRWFSLSAVLALTVVLVASDASQARERRLLGRFRGRSDTVVMTNGETTETIMVRQGRFGRRSRTYVQESIVSTAPTDTVMVREGRFGRRSGTYIQESVVSTAPTTEPMMVRERRLGRRLRGNSTAMVVTGPRTVERMAFFSGRPSPVLLTLQVPAQAEILFDGQKMTQTGTFRQYISPPIDPAGKYAYEITAKWMENGQQHTETRKIDVRAGQRLVVDLTKPAPEKIKTK